MNLKCRHRLEEFERAQILEAFGATMALPGPSADVSHKAGMGKHDKKDEIARRHSQRGEFERASSLFRENLAWSKNARGPKDPVTLEDQELLSFSLHELGLYKQAEDLDRQTLQVRREDQGLWHADTLETQHNLALNLFKLGRYTEAADLDRRTLKAREKASGKEDQTSLSSRHNLAASLQELKAYGEAADLNRETLKIRERNSAKDDDDVIATRHNLATNLHGLAQYDKAADLLQKNLSVLRKTRTTDDPQLVRNEQSLTINLKALDRIRTVEEDRGRDHGTQKKAWNTKTLHEPRLVEQKAAPKRDVDREHTVANAGRGHAVTEGHQCHNDDKGRNMRTRARDAAATNGNDNKESAGAEIQRSLNDKHERRPRKENRREEPHTSSRTENNGSTRLDIPKKDGPENTLSAVSSHKRASSVSEAVIPRSTRIETPSTPTIILSPGKRDADLGKCRERSLV